MRNKRESANDAGLLRPLLVSTPMDLLRQFVRAMAQPLLEHLPEQPLAKHGVYRGFLKPLAA